MEYRMAKATTSLLTILFVAACSIRTGSAFSVRPITRGRQNIPRSLCSLSLASNENGGDGDLFLESNNDGPILSQLSTTSRRRLFLQFAGAISAVAPALAPAHADPSFVSNVQGPLQDSIAPGHWIGQFVGINSKTERWEFPFPAEDVSSALVAVFDDLTPERREKLFLPNYKVKRADASGVHVLTWTKNEWLDSFDVSFQPAGANGEGSIATASFYATGFLPTSIPLAPVLNVAMAWFPFASPGPRGEMLQDFRLRAIHGLLIKQLQKYH
jgi:hypothetical protein